MSIDYRILLFAGPTILLWGFWGFWGKLALEKNMAPTSVFLAEVFTSAVCAVPVVLILLAQASGSVAVYLLEPVRRGFRSRIGAGPFLLLLRA